MNCILLQHKNDLSFTGERCSQVYPNKNIGILIKPSKQSNIKIWCPIDEIKRIILPDMTIIEGNELLGYCSKQNGVIYDK
ncbi:hypothetical protein FACS1894127_1750 [Clostridia bacterium]|nr:hypothetical protein FACS1894127_1750 [Clostridia bacterium]